ncbi:MAG: protein phosphatase CheZ [Bacteroidetes bacterium]|nr:protein phosphatase CheZ [Bacteroidota bacterium]MCL5268234.1 protein phosphatase CheZ [Bacteroidota bacterium]
MDSKNLGGILDKINELRALFIFGQRVIPFLEELFYFVHDIVPVLEEINASIYESASKMPRASSQLNKVTQATELATTEILDNLDGVISRLNTIDSHFQTATEDLAAIDKLDDSLLDVIKSSLDGSHQEALREISGLQERKRSHLKAVKLNATGLEQSLKEIRAKSNDIMISLQVQDITSQQIASVNHLIGSVQERLSNLIDRFKISGAELINEIERTDHRTFDPNASYDRSDERQKSADVIVSKSASAQGNSDGPGKNPVNPTSQEEIDKLFGKGA